MRRYPPRPSRQRGVVVLLVLALLLAVGSFVVVRSVSDGVRRARDDQSTTGASLAAAEQALLGYATRYPDDPAITSPTAGPGHLPCPDTRFDAGDVPGQADPPCALSSATETGLLPWRTLDLPTLQDTDGAPLWYALADAFRNNPAGIVNPSTRGELRLDVCTPGARDIAALLFAPGTGLTGQNRSTANAIVRYAAANYLEGQNATRGDGCFSSLRSPIANDVVHAIDRATLMTAVQKRVLADVANALERYYADPDGDDVGGVDPDCAAASLPDDCDDALPWLSPFEDPTLAAYRGDVGTRRGLLPLRQIGVDFPAGFHATWDLGSGGSLTHTGPAPPDPVCVRRTAAVCTMMPSGFGAAASYRSEVSGSGSGPYGAGFCRWPGGHALRCTTTLTIADPTGSENVVERSFVLDIDDLPRRLAPPSATAPRLEDARVIATSLPATASIRITVSDRLLPANEPLGVAVLTVPGGTAVTDFALLNVPSDLEIDDDGVIDPVDRRSPGELPQWFTANLWQQFVFVAYAEAYAPGAVADDCIAGSDCLHVVDTRHDVPAVTHEDVRALVLAAGPALATQTRPGADPAQWFEGGNASLDDRYEVREAMPDFNDLLLRSQVHD
ncbi:MAG: hypothetical protein IT493_05995 [Gammaproteobacteria bacterium]|nr:hypothetical protein [Gammaproteobacteria bacterium]